MTLICFALKEEATSFQKIRHRLHGLTQIEFVKIRAIRVKDSTLAMRQQPP
jgi:hypothetical protein